MSAGYDPFKLEGRVGRVYVLMVTLAGLLVALAAVFAVLAVAVWAASALTPAWMYDGALTWLALTAIRLVAAAAIVFATAMLGFSTYDLVARR